MPEKYQEEIEEILQKAGEVAPRDPPREQSRTEDRGPRPVRAMRRHSSSAPGLRRARPVLSPGRLLLAGLVIFLVAALFRWTPLIWLGLGLLVVAYLLFFVTPRPVSHDKRWRGQPVAEDQTLWVRLKRWLRG